MNIDAAINELRADIATVPPSRMSRAFHINTKMSHLLAAWRGGLANGADPLAFGRWCGLAGDLVATLPKTALAVDGASGKRVDPFRGMRAVFGTNRTIPTSEFPKIVELMLSESEGAGLSCVRQDHGNLVELAAGVGLITSSAEKTFFNDVMLQSTYSEFEETMLADLQVQDLLGEAKLTKLPNGYVAVSSGKLGGVFDTPDGKVLRMTGYGGCICDFPLYEYGNAIVAIQGTSHVGTSVTNLSEKVYSTLKEYKPDCKVFQVYERDLLAGSSDLTEIELDDCGRAGWLATDNPDLLAGVLSRMGVGPDIA